MKETPDFFRKNIDSEENPDNPLKEKTELSDVKSEIEEWKEKAEKLLRQNRTVFESFSESIIPKLQFSEAVKIDFKTMTVHLDTDFFYRKGFNEQQMIWAAYHELSHFRDLISDPKKFMENFGHIRDKAEKYGEKIRQILDVPKEEFSEEEIKKGKIDSCDLLAYKSWHTFYNCLDDVYVNSLVERGAPFSFSEKQGKHHSEVANLYREVLFKGSDYSKLSKNKQFSYYFLRKAMLPDEDIVIEEDVSEMLEREVFFGGQKMKAVEMIDNVLKSKTKSGIKAGDRYLIIRKTLEPLFEELYQKDLEDFEKLQEELENGSDSDNQEDSSKNENSSNKNSDSGETESEDEDQKGVSSEEGEDGENSENSSSGDEEDNQGGGEQSGGNSGDMGSKEENLDNEFNPGKDKQRQKDGEGPLIPGIQDINPEDIDEIIDTIEKQIEDFKKQGKDFDKKIERKRQEQLQKWLDKHDVTKQEYDKYEKVKEKIEPYLRRLSAVWDSIIFGHGTNIERGTKPSSEGDVNVDRFIKYYADIISGQIREVKPMEKKTQKELPSNKPEVIKIRFVGDASGSMDEPKQEVLEMVYVLIMTSLRDFETKLNRTRGKTKSKLTIQTEGWIFGDTALKLKSFRKGRDYEGEFVDTIKEFAGLRKNLGYTWDNTVYEKIQEELTVKDRSEIKSKKAMDIIFEVTDGGSSGPSKTQEAVNNLEKEGLIIRAFQIGVSNESDPDSIIFNNVWNKDSNGGNLREQRGFQIGDEIEKLVPAIAGALKKYLSGIKI